MSQPTPTEFYIGKNILLTGATGFVGKVLLDKLLRSLPDLGVIYLLIRGKKGSNVTERFKKEVLGSQCFDRLKKMKGVGFDDYISSKVVAIDGDLLKDQLGIAPEVQQVLVDRVNVVINCAASIDFNAAMKDALGSNYYGCQRMLELSSRMKNLDNFVHVSTAYVNCDKTGFIEEKIYEDLTIVDTDKYAAELYRTCQNFTEKQTQQVIGKFPNTYTFTKALAERMLIKKRPAGMSLTIMRPTIVGASLRDPFPGWIDNMIGSAAIYFFSGIGLIKIFKGNENLIGDQIPVDFVADEIIVGAAYMARKGQIEVFHIGTSLRNPVTWRTARECVVEYWNENVPKLRVSKCSVQTRPSVLYYNLYNYARAVPALMYRGLANITQNEKMKKDASRWLKVLEKAHMINEIFKHFNNNEWIFDSQKTLNLINYMTPEERNTFLLDVTIINWRQFLMNFNYGLQKYILKENVDPPGDPQSTDLFSLFNYNYFSDIKWAKSQGQPFATKSKREHISLVMNSSRVQQAILQLQRERMKKLGRVSMDPEKESEKIGKEIQKQANEICEQMFADYNFKMIRLVAWMVNKVFKQLYDKVVLDENFLTALANHNVKEKGPIIFTPTHKSYLDFLLASYIFYAFKIKCPHVAAAEDFLQMSIIPSILRACGAFFLRRKQFEENPLYKTIFYEYVQRLLTDECYLEFFVEGTRSRTGKIMAPKFGLLGIVVDTVVENKVPDATIVPITINYEKVLEADTYPLELLGENKVKESLLRVLSAVKLLNANHGRVYIEFGEPISVRKQLAQVDVNYVDSIKDRKLFTEELGLTVVYSLIDKLVIMPTSMVAAIILMHRKGIQEEQLVKKIEWLANQILVRGGKIGSINDCSAVIAVRNSINHLQDAVVKTKRNIFELQVTPNFEYKNILLLSYYKNQLVHVFFEEAICCCALNSFGHQIAYKEGLGINRLWEETEFLLQLLNKELFVRITLNSQQKLNDLVEKMAFRGTVSYVSQDEKTIKVHETTGEQAITFLCSLVWPLVEAYWVTLIYIYSIQRNHTQLTVKRLIQQVQWFAESMYEERVVDHYEACSNETVTNAVQSYQQMKIIQIDKELNEKNQQIDEYVKVVVTEERLLELESYIKKFMKNAFTKSVKTPIDFVKKNIIDFPIMAKL